RSRWAGLSRPLRWRMESSGMELTLWAPMAKKVSALPPRAAAAFPAGHARLAARGSPRAVYRRWGPSAGFERGLRRVRESRRSRAAWLSPSHDGRAAHLRVLRGQAVVSQDCASDARGRGVARALGRSASRP